MKNVYYCPECGHKLIIENTNSRASFDNLSLPKKNMTNPWKNLPKHKPYILPDDKQYIEKYKNYNNLELDTLPEPYVGGINKSKVVFLALNPGFDDSNITINMNSKKFIKDNLDNLKNPISSNFYYFKKGRESTGGYIWWSKKLKPLLTSGVTHKQLLEKMMVIEFFPYHSRKYKHINTKHYIPSQEFSFELTREAMRQNKTIIIMRGERLWLKAIPELIQYPYLTLSSKQNVTISSNNLGENSFDNILKLLKS